MQRHVKRANARKGVELSQPRAPEFDNSVSEGDVDGPSSADQSGDDRNLPVPGKNISYKRFDVSPELMKEAESSIKAVYPNLEPSFMKVSIEVSIFIMLLFIHKRSL